MKRNSLSSLKSTKLIIGGWNKNGGLRKKLKNYQSEGKLFDTFEDSFVAVYKVQQAVVN